MIGAVQRWLAWLGAALSLALVAFVAGRRDGRADAEVERANATNDAYRKRERIDDAIDQDTDLVDRARRIGIVRDGE